jgi:hypothetical protein
MHNVSSEAGIQQRIAVEEEPEDKGNDNNFKVLVRVRPPLPRELPANFERGGHLLDF